MWYADCKSETSLLRPISLLFRPRVYEENVQWHLADMFDQKSFFVIQHVWLLSLWAAIHSKKESIYNTLFGNGCKFSEFAVISTRCSIERCAGSNGVSLYGILVEFSVYNCIGIRKIARKIVSQFGLVQLWCVMQKDLPYYSGNVRRLCRLGHFCRFV